MEEEDLDDDADISSLSDESKKRIEDFNKALSHFLGVTVSNESLTEGAESVRVKLAWSDADGVKGYNGFGSTTSEAILDAFKKANGDLTEVREVTSSSTVEEIIDAAEDYAAEMGEGLAYVEDVTHHKVYVDEFFREDN
jgi:hypothetical protein